MNVCVVQLIFDELDNLGQRFTSSNPLEIVSKENFCKQNLKPDYIAKLIMTLKEYKWMICMGIR